MRWLSRFVRRRRRSAAPIAEPLGLPNEVATADEYLVKAYWEWSRACWQDPAALPRHPFPIWLTRDVVPLSIRLSHWDGGSIEEWRAGLQLNIGFRTEADLVSFRDRWDVDRRPCQEAR